MTEIKWNLAWDGPNGSLSVSRKLFDTYEEAVNDANVNDWLCKELCGAPGYIYLFTNPSTGENKYISIAYVDPKMVKLQEWLRSMGVMVKTMQEIEEMRQLTIERKNLTLPPEFEMLNLTDLHLPYNGLKEIPREIFTQTNLQTLQLSGNQIEDIPFDIVKLKNLKHLYLDNNLIDKLPYIAELNLEILNLDRNFIYRDDIPKDIIEKIPTIYIDK